MSPAPARRGGSCGRGPSGPPCTWRQRAICQRCTMVLLGVLGWVTCKGKTREQACRRRLLMSSSPPQDANFRSEFPGLIALHANSFRDLGATKWCTRPGALREKEMVHDANAGAQAVVSHMGAPGANGWYLNPYALRARIRSGRSGQDVVDLAGTGSPVRGRVKLGRLRLAVPGIKGAASPTWKGVRQTARPISGACGVSSA